MVAKISLSLFCETSCALSGMLCASARGSVHTYDVATIVNTPWCHCVRDRYHGMDQWIARILG